MLHIALRIRKISRDGHRALFSNVGFHKKILKKIAYEQKISKIKKIKSF